MALEPATIDGNGTASTDENHGNDVTTDFSVRRGIPDGPATATYERALLQPDDLRRRLKQVFSVLRIQDTEKFIDEIFEGIPSSIDDHRQLQMLDWEIGRRIVCLMNAQEAQEGLTESKWPLPLLTERNRKVFTKLLRTIWNSNIRDNELSTIFSESKVIARGGYGLVLAPDAVDIVLKEIDLSRGDKQKNEIRVKREEKSLRVLETEAPGLSPRLLAEGTMDGQHVIAMERIYGRTLQEEVRAGHLDTAYDKSVRSVEAVRALIRLHHQHMVHRDIKPGNMMWVPEMKKVQIIDYGLVRTRHLDELDQEQELIDLTYTLAGKEPIGTLEYMSPDQARNSAAFHPRNDAYSMGLSLYKIWTGDDPRAHLHQKVDPQPNGRKETVEESIERKLGILRSERFREYLPKLKKLPAEIAMVIELLLHKDERMEDDPEWMQALQREKRAQELLEQFEKKGPSWFAPIHRYGGKIISTLNRWKYKIAAGLLLGTGVTYGIKKLTEPPAHLRVISPAETPDKQFTRLTTTTYGNGVREPVILLPADLGGKAWKFKRAIDYFIGDEYIGSEGMVEGEGVGNNGSVTATCYWEGGESLVKMYNGLNFHRRGESTHAHHVLREDEEVPAQVQHCAMKAHIREADEHSDLRKLFQRLHARANPQSLYVKTVDETLRVSKWGKKRTDEQFIENFTTTIERNIAPFRPPPEVKKAPQKFGMLPGIRRKLSGDELRQVLREHRIPMNPMPDAPEDSELAALDALPHQSAIGNGSHLAIADPKSPHLLQKTVRKERQPVG